jgi:hypothetical protein
MIYSLISMSIDAIHLFYYLLKSSIYGTYYLYCYFTGQVIDMTEIPVKELEEIKEKMDNQEKVLNELTSMLKDKKDKKYKED